MTKLYRRPTGMTTIKRLTPQQREEISVRIKNGEPATKLSVEYGVSTAAIYYSSGRCKRKKYSNEWHRKFQAEQREKIMKAIYNGEL